MMVPKQIRNIAVERGRELRKEQTPAEEKLWQNLRDRRYVHFKIRRQHPLYYSKNGDVSFFIADFAIPEKKLIIELDGEIHDYQIAADTERTAILKELGYEVVRFRNEEVISAIEHVLQKLREIVENK